jgi:hypothetical protein
MSAVHINPDLRSALIDQGWDGNEQGPLKLLTGSRFGNKRHRHLYFELLGADKVRLYVHLSVRDRVLAMKAQTINIARRNWAKSLTRWVSVACLALQDVWQKEDNEKALNELRERRRRETLAAILEPTGVTPEELKTIARVQWEWQNDDDVPVKAPEIGRVSIETIGTASSNNWDGPTKVRKVARLFTFLQQEGW